MFSLKEIIEQIRSHSGKSEAAVKKLIKEKQEELSELVSEEGAAYIVARELGLNLLQESTRQLKIKNLVSGMRSVDLTGKIVRVFEPRDWEKKGKKGSVANILLADETGVVRLVLWNDEVNLIRDGTLKEDDVVRLRGGYVKKGYNNALEVSKGKGVLEKVDEEVTVPVQQELKPSGFAAKRISEFTEGDAVRCRACLVQLYRRNPFYEVCPGCGARVAEENGKWMCKDHGDVNPKPQLVVSGVIDDGFGNIRAVFFSDRAEKLLGKSAEEVKKLADEKKEVMAVYDDFAVLGKEMNITGTVRRNSFTEEIELIVQAVEAIDPAKECEKLLGALEKKKKT